MRTYKNDKGVLVTDTRIITEEFKKADSRFRHFNLLRVVEKVMQYEFERMNPDCTVKMNYKIDTPLPNDIIISEYKKHKNSKTTELMYQLSHVGYALLLSIIDTPKLPNLQQKLYQMRRAILLEHIGVELIEENAQSK